MRGDVAAPLIYTATALDYLSIDRDKYDVVAALGNSMGWYSALACAGAVSVEEGFRISNAMGLNSQTHGPGGQILLRSEGRRVGKECVRTGRYRGSTEH